VIRGACGLVLSLMALPAFASGALRADGGFLRDSTGGAVILHGANVAGNSKIPPFEPVADVSILDPLPGWGMNAIRLLFTWEAYEPQMGTYDASYLDYYRKAVQAAGARGLSVIVDFHQDGFSRFSVSGCGEGFPKWALPPTVPPVTPDNGPACQDWGTLMMSDTTLKTTWDAFYADSNGARTRYLAMIGSVAQALASESAVIGYDLLNEPGGDEVTQIAPLYELAAQAIRAADPAALLFVEPSPLVTSVGKQSMLPRPTFENFVYAPHYYDPIAYFIKSWTGVDESAAFDRMTSFAGGWGAPLLVGEFGADVTTDQVDPYMSAMYRQLARTFASGTQWAYTPGWTDAAKDGWDVENFSIVDGTGAMRANFRPRPYARRVAGTPSALDITEGKTPGDSTLDLTWVNDPAAGATELFVPAAWFGGHVAVHGSGDVSCTTDGAIARCTAPTAGTKQVHVAAPRGCGLTGAEAALILLALSWRRRRMRHAGKSAAPRP
jgi:endoglycosylceramidase